MTALFSRHTVGLYLLFLADAGSLFDASFEYFSDCEVEFASIFSKNLSFSSTCLACIILAGAYCPSS